MVSAVTIHIYTKSRAFVSGSILYRPAGGIHGLHVSVSVLTGVGVMYNFVKNRAFCLEHSTLFWKNPLTHNCLGCIETVGFDKDNRKIENRWR